MVNLKELEKSLKLIRDNSIYGLPMYKLDDKTYDYCRNDAIDTYRYLYEYMGVKALVEPVGESRRNNMANNWLEMVKEGHFYAIDDEGNVVDFGKAWVCEVETCIGCEPEVTLRVTPIKVMKNEGASAHSFERECVEYHALKHANEENLKLIDKLKKENEELRQQLANYESESINYADNDPKAVYLPLSTRRIYGKTKMLKEMLNSMYGSKAFKYDIKKVIFSGPCTIVFWADGTKTMVRAQENETVEDKEKGLAMAIAKRVYGDKGNYNNIFKRWIYGAEWKKKKRKIKKAIKLARKNDDPNYAEYLKDLMHKDFDLAVTAANEYANKVNSDIYEFGKVLKEFVDNAFQGKRKDMGVIDEAKDSDEQE